MSIVIAIDGPAGTGKSTVSREVARRLGLEYLDTGATYRVGALYCLREGVNLSHQDDVTAMVATMNVQMRLDPDNPHVILDGEDVTPLLHTDTISLVVSSVATNLSARAVLRDVQRKLIDGSRERAGVVVEGRDITSVVAPDAEVRVLLTADEDVRIARRTGDGADPATVRESVLGRDQKDSTVVQFHTAADGVVEIDTTHLALDEVVGAVLALAKEAGA
ncbi:(d)CMP kinase [Demequina sp.]|uniref:(d)CMP kinase n=1 Tax=Demequina sp. TaxID=2050685 RepID=UPI0025BF2D46|nr:(d)CMP kinase [Demequina sp.]